MQPLRTVMIVSIKGYWLKSNQACAVFKTQHIKRHGIYIACTFNIYYVCIP